MLNWPVAVTYVNGRIVTPEGEARSIRVRRRILSIDSAPERGDAVVDLDGRWVLPGLINAHDHLELNHYGRLKLRDSYGNAREWIDDLRPIIRHSPAIREKSRFALSERLFIGGLKNLLSGVTTVAHHNPLYCAFGLHFPVRIVQRFGWAHSLGLEHGPVGAHGEPGGVVSEKYQATPSGMPFIVHAAEGIDDTAAAEVEQLDERRCLQSNTVLVHGLAIATSRWHELFGRGVGLVWCPASNVFLFGRTLCMPCLLQEAPARRRICLGSDSRVTGSRDLLDELRVAACARVAPDDLMAMVTSVAADVLRLEDAGRIRVGAPADLTVLPASGHSAGETLLKTSRADIQLVLRRGSPVVGDPALEGAFTARGVHASEISVDGNRRLIQTAIARRIERSLISEPGVAGC